jgi:glycosyltransferase involved in cell wall biosynthesis
LEAMSAEIPVVASQAGSYTETITHGETGLIAEIGNVQALASALAHLMDDSGLRKAMGMRGRRHVLAHYSIRREGDALLRVYLDLVDSPATSAGARYCSACASPR